ncbi:Ig-like repeat protein Blp2 [Acinetobacter haemolyticus]|uniref:Ig-like repeat protein Blp2 n=1 Tax=Acinetobacter haemolyticus TaxID=29430 RepID=UPI0021D01C37|nr:Ig-like repeat protein Blp2 [Acinetobacter haemolyticus]MCU4386003.1 BapA prefix-like domain-containing protein [Acinetobacter haemolyticus]
MTNVVVSSKKNLMTLQDAQMKEVILNQPSIVQIGITQADVKSITKQGNDLVITLKNGEKIVISDFYNENGTSEHSLALVKADGTYEVAQFDQSGEFIRYVPATQLSQFAYTQSPTQTPMNQDGADDFGITKSQMMKAGLVALAAEGIYLWAVKDDDKKSDSKVVEKPAPKLKATLATDDSQTITVKTDANVVIQIKDSSGKLIVSAQADAQGNYTFKLSKPLPHGEKLTVIAINNDGKSTTSEVIGTKDVTPPDAPTAQLNADGTIVTGKTEANAKVSIFDSDGKLLGTVKANKEGLYSIQVTPPLTDEKGGTVIAEDAAGNKSEASKVVAGKDTVAPEKPLVEVNKEGSIIQGKAEANAKVLIKDADGNIIGSGTVDAQGKFEVNISPALTDGKKGTIIIEDAAGNQSKPVEINAGKDTIAPDQATVQINAAGDTITGTAEANAKIEIRSADGKVIGSGTVGADGKFTVSISPALTDKNSGKVYVIDAAGNRSVEANVIGNKDTIAPTKPILEKVVDDVGAVKGPISTGGSTDDARPTLSGRGEAKAVLTIYDNGQPIGTVTVGNDGKWSFEITQDLALGSHKITLTQTDAAGNTSEVSDAFNFTVVAPVTTNTLAQTESFETQHAEISLADSVDLEKLLANTEASTLSFNQLETIALDEVMISSDQHSNQLDDVLDQLVPEQTLVPSDTAVSDTGLSTVYTDFSQTIKSDPFALFDTVQHPMI